MKTAEGAASRSRDLRFQNGDSVANREAWTGLELRAASAGTGKTTSLVLEYLKTLQTVPARRIAAVTFTRLGAVDLRERLREGLRLVVETGRFLDFAPSQLGLYRQAFAELGSANITTIHGFFRDLLRLNAPALGLDPEFRYLDEGEALEHFRDAATGAMSDCALRDAPGGAILAAWGWDRTLDQLVALYTRRVYAPFHLGDVVTGDELEEALVALYARAAHGYEARLARRALGPTDVERETLRLLELPEALERVRARVGVLFVDEFQDVNPLQARIFTGLGLERTLLVGDPKQSIYAFRDADVGAFLDVYEVAKRLEPLRHSYRHGPLLCGVYSDLAARLFPEFAEVGLPANVISGRVQRGGGNPLVGESAELHIFEGSRLELARAAEAAFLAERLSGYGADLSWGEIAVLIRSRASLPLLMQALAAHDVPALEVAGQRYYDRREIRDAANLLRARLGFERSTMAALARLPGIDLSPLLIERFLDAPDPWRALEELKPATDRLLELYELISSASDAIDLLARAWAFLGPRGFVATPQATANLDGLLYQLAARGLRDPRAALVFLEHARLAEAEGDEPMNSGDAVRVMTVHASKGLEFRVCAVFDLARAERQSSSELVVAPDGEIALRSRRAGRHRSILEHWHRREAGESSRLLYVAATRAKDHLIITGSLSTRSRGWLATLASIGYLETPPPGLSVERHRVDVVNPRSVFPTMPTARFRRDDALATARFSRPQRRLRSSSVLAVGAEDKQPEVLELESDQLVATLVRYAIACEFDPDLSEHQHTLEVQYLLHAHNENERSMLLARVWQLIRAYREMYPGRFSRLEDRSELPFALCVASGSIWHGVIDRLYREADASDTFVLEAYKTDEISPESVAECARSYYREMALWREAVRMDHPQCELQVRLSFLRPQRIIQVSESALDQAWLELSAEGGVVSPKSN